MADDKRTGPGRGRRQPAPTIDLSATEVKTEQPAEAATPDAAGAAHAGNAGSAPSNRAGLSRYAAVGAALVAGVALTLAVMWAAGHLAPGRGETDSGALRERIAAPEAKRNPADREALENLSARIGRLEQAIARLPSGRPAAAIGEQLTAIENAMKAVNVSVTDLARRADETAAAQNAARQRAEAETKSAEATQRRLDALEQAAKVTQDKVAENSGADATARRALAGLALRDAVARGAPFSAELAALKKLGGDAAKLAPLEAFAQSGVPTEAELMRKFAALLPGVISAAGVDAPHTGGFLDRLQANAGKLVRIRPIGEVSGEDTAAVVARIELKAAHNDIAGIDGELKKLPAKARALTAAWAKAVADRNAALAASRTLVADSAAALTGR